MLHLILSGSGVFFTLSSAPVRMPGLLFRASVWLGREVLFRISTPCYLWFLIWGHWQAFTLFCGGCRITSTLVGAGRCGKFFFCLIPLKSAPEMKPRKCYAFKSDFNPYVSKMWFHSVHWISFLFLVQGENIVAELIWLNQLKRWNVKLNESFILYILECEFVNLLN